MAKKPRPRGRGEGGIEELPSGLFRARVDAGVDPATGKRERLSRTFRQIDDARKWLRQQQAIKDRTGVVAVATAETLSVWAAAWLAGKDEGTEKGTSVKYRQHFANHILPRLGAAKLRDLTPAAVSAWSAWLGENGRTAATRVRSMKSLSICLNAAVAAGKLAANPLRPGGGVGRPKVRRREAESFTRAEARAIVAASRGHRYEALVLLMLDSGARTGEALALKWADVDTVGGTVRIAGSVQQVVGERPSLKPPKSPAGRRTVALGVQTLVMLAAYREARRAAGKGGDSDLLFERKGGGYLNKSNLTTPWRRLVKLAGVRYLRLYALRHTSASLLVAAGVNIKAVSRRLGHESIEITLKFYAHLMPGSDELAASTLASILHGP